MKEKELNAELTLLLEELEGYLTASLYERVKRALNALPDPQPEATPIGVEGLPNGMIIKEFEMMPSGVGCVFAGYCFKKETSQLLEKNFKVLGGYTGKKWYTAINKMKEAGFGTPDHEYKSIHHADKAKKKLYEDLPNHFEKFKE